jgi:mannose-1-phosphate guanylyltransferase
MTKAIILVGGEGTRLRPLTYTRPKPMLPVAGVSILERKLVHLARHGIDEAVLSLGYRPDAFMTAFPSGEVAGVRIKYAVEPSPLDTAGAIRFAAEAAGYLDLAETFIVVNGDVLTELDITAQLSSHQATGAEATIALTQVEDPSAFGVVPTDSDGRVLAFVEKPLKEEAPTDWINAGTYILEASIFDRIPEGRKVSIERETFPTIAAEGRLFAVRSPAYWIDAGTPVLFLQANADVLRMQHGEGSFVAASAVVHAQAFVVASVIDTDVIVEAGASVIRSVLLPGVRVAAGAVIEDSIVGAGASVGERASITAVTVVGDHSIVDSDMSLRGERFMSGDQRVR